MRAMADSRIAAVDHDVAADAERLAEHRNLQQLLLGDEADDERHAREGAPDVEVAEVVADDHVALPGLQVLEALDVEVDAADAHDAATPDAADAVDHPAAARDQRPDDRQQAEDDRRDGDPGIGAEPPEVAQRMLRGEGQQRVVCCAAGASAARLSEHGSFLPQRRCDFHLDAAVRQ